MKKSLIFIVSILLIGTLLIFTGCGTNEENTSAEQNNTSSETSNIQAQEVEFYEGTNVPSAESVLGYEQPVVENDLITEDGTYYAGYSAAGIDGYNSNVKASDYDTYSKVLTENNFTLTNTTPEDDSTVYEYTSDTSTVKLTVSDTNFEISITLK